MVPASMPELTMSSDVEYLSNKLEMEKDPQEAEKLFRGEIYNALTTVSRQIDNMIHAWKHY